MDLNLTTFHLRLGALAYPPSAPLLAQVKGRGGFQIKKSQDVAVSQGRLPVTVMRSWVESTLRSPGPKILYGNVAFQLEHLKIIWTVWAAQFFVIEGCCAQTSAALLHYPHHPCVAAKISPGIAKCLPGMRATT